MITHSMCIVWLQPVHSSNSYCIIYYNSHLGAFAMEKWFSNGMKWNIELAVTNCIHPQMVTYIWHPILHQSITLWLHMIHESQHILSFHHDAHESLEFEPLMWPTTFDYYLFHVYLFVYATAVILDRLCNIWRGRPFSIHSPNANDIVDEKCRSNNTGYIKQIPIEEKYTHTHKHRNARERERKRIKNVSINLYANSQEP